MIASRLLDEMARCGIPASMRESLARYILEGCPVGEFLTAVLENDLRGAVGAADRVNLALIPNYVQFLFWHAPSECWGCRGITQDWRALVQAETRRH